MSEEIDLTAMHELLAMLGKMIAEEEANVRQRLDRLSQYDDPYIEDQMRREWAQFHLRIKPIQEQQEYILKQLAQIAACKPPKPMLFKKGEYVLIAGYDDYGDSPAG